jgi:hypothetical protein
MSQQINARVVVVGIDIGKNSFHVSVRTHAGRLCCDKSGLVTRSKPGLPSDRDGGLRRGASSQSST